MILSDKKIRELVDKNNLIENYNEKNLLIQLFFYLKV